MTDAPTITRLSYHAGQQQVVDERARYNTVVCGRRWGKTELGMDLAIDVMTSAYPVGWFAPRYKDTHEVWTAITRRLRGVIVSASRQQNRIEIAGGGVLDVWTLEDENAGRGRKYGRVIVDEAAKAKNLGQVWQFAIRPTLTDYSGDAWFLTTPQGMNFVWELYERGLDSVKYPSYKSWQMPTASNPYIRASEIEEARATLPEEVFRQEYLAAFLENEGAVFRRIHDAIFTDAVARSANCAYVMGVDWGQRLDWTVLTVIERETGRVVDIDRFNQIGWDVQRKRLEVMAERWDCSYALVEENNMTVLIEAMQADSLPVVPYQTTQQSKADLILALQLAFERGEIHIPDDAALIHELMAFTATRLPSGRWRYEAPEGVHDDMVMSLALAWWAAMSGGALQTQPAQASKFAGLGDGLTDGKSRWRI